MDLAPDSRMTRSEEIARCVVPWMAEVNAREAESTAALAAMNAMAPDDRDPIATAVLLFNADTVRREREAWIWASQQMLLGHCMEYASRTAGAEMFPGAKPATLRLEA